MREHDCNSWTHGGVLQRFPSVQSSAEQCARFESLFGPAVSVNAFAIIGVSVAQDMDLDESQPRAANRIDQVCAWST